MNNEATRFLMGLDDKALADVLEHVLVRRAIGFDETFSALAPYEQLLAVLRVAVEAFQRQMVSPS